MTSTMMSQSRLWEELMLGKVWLKSWVDTSGRLVHPTIFLVDFLKSNGIVLFSTYKNYIKIKFSNKSAKI